MQSGNFSSWWENKRKKDQFDLAENEKHLKEIQRLKKAAKRTADWADKNESTKIGFNPVKEHDRSIATRAYIGAKTKKMQSRVTQMAKRIDREIAEKEGLLQDLEKPADLKLTPLSHHRDILVTIRDYTVQYTGSAHPVFTGLTCSVHRGDRIALHGKNGCGKSTLIKAILQKDASPSGNRRLPDRFRVDRFLYQSGYLLVKRLPFRLLYRTKSGLHAALLHSKTIGFRTGTVLQKHGRLFGGPEEKNADCGKSAHARPSLYLG